MEEFRALDTDDVQLERLTSLLCICQKFVKDKLEMNTKHFALALGNDLDGLENFILQFQQARRSSILSLPLNDNDMKVSLVLYPQV
jgi:hypothetical protein